jgi:hypothetical protein
MALQVWEEMGRRPKSWARKFARLILLSSRSAVPGGEETTIRWKIDSLFE